MKRNHGKQTTLFQSWGAKRSTNDRKQLQEQPSTSNCHTLKNDVVDLCDLDDDDELLARAVDETLCETDNNRISIQKDVFNLSIGADNLENSLLPSQNLSTIPDLPGFDKCAGKLWIYPTNYPVREYQFNIVPQALFKNTMVTLPTGLGKTFIAAVVMYNFYRWYPQGKVVFMAPTKPLVAQQIEACYNIMGIPQEDTAEMTGNMFPAERMKAWQQKRVFFLTPQVMTNDLSRGSCPAVDVKCLVIDEAHKAQGNHAYCQVVRELVKYSREFRVLALSATPGSDIKSVQQVLENLIISHIELRTEESPDIKQYSFERKVEKVVVPLGDELSIAKNKYLQVMDVVVNRLKRLHVIYNRDTQSMSKFLILKAREAFRQNPPEQIQRSHFGIVEGDFAIAMSLYHGFELLQLHGLRSLYNYLTGIVSGEKSNGRTRTELAHNSIFKDLMMSLHKKFGAQDSSLHPSQKKPFVTGHPKMDRLERIVLDHFLKYQDGNSKDRATRVMIFSQYRDSVEEITRMLRQHDPMVKVMNFIGQSSAGKSTKGFTQKEQLQVMKQFRDGGYNTLVSTCVGEEGLDIGEVDLIICFDAHKSPIRLVQRMGRTGRKREGRIVMLVTEGKEEQIYNQSQYSKRSIHKAIMNSSKSLHFYQHSPRMVPDGLVPACHKMHISVQQAYKPNKQITTCPSKTQKTQPKLANMTDKNAPDSEEIITKAEYMDLKANWFVPQAQVPLIPKSTFHCLLKRNETESEQVSNRRVLSLNDWIPWQNTLQTTHLVDHSLRSRHFVELMEFADLNHSLDPSEDNYGLEMQAYLRDEDVLKPGQVDGAPDGKITSFCVPVSEGRLDIEASREAGNSKFQKAFVRTKRKSRLLPQIESDMEKNESDDDLPVVHIGSTAKGTGEGRQERLHLETTSPEKTLDKSHAKKSNSHHTESKTKLKITETEHESCIGVIKEKRHNRRKRKSGSNATFVKIIADTDQNDFLEGNVVQDISTFTRPQVFDVELSSVEYADDQKSNVPELNHDYTGNIDVDTGINAIEEVNVTPVQLFTFSHNSTHAKPGSEEDASYSNYRVKTPPPIEEVEEIFNSIENLETLPQLDLLELAENWEREGISDTGRNRCETDFTNLKCNPSLKVTPQKVFIPFQDILPELLPKHTEGLQMKTPNLSIVLNNTGSLVDLFDTSFTQSCLPVSTKLNSSEKKAHNSDTPIFHTESVRKKRALFKFPNIEKSEISKSRFESERNCEKSKDDLDSLLMKDVADLVKIDILQKYINTSNFHTLDITSPQVERSMKQTIALDKPVINNKPSEQEIGDDSLFHDDFSDSELIDAMPDFQTPCNKSTQFTFTQALACVHGNSEPSSSESMSVSPEVSAFPSNNNVDRPDQNVSRKYSKQLSSNSASVCVRNKEEKENIGVPPSFLKLNQACLEKVQLAKQNIASSNNLNIEKSNDTTLDHNKAVNKQGEILEMASAMEGTEHSIFSDSDDDDDDVEIPKFDLGFNIDDDIIPPSPNASESFSQNSLSGRLSLSSFGCGRGRLSVFKNQSLDILSNLNEKHKSDGKIKIAANEAAVNKRIIGREPEVFMKKRSILPTNQSLLTTVEEFVQDNDNKHLINTVAGRSENNTGDELDSRKCVTNVTGTATTDTCDDVQILEMIAADETIENKDNKSDKTVPIIGVEELEEWDSDDDFGEMTNFDLGWEGNPNNVEPQSLPCQSKDFDDDFTDLVPEFKSLRTRTSSKLSTMVEAKITEKSLLFKSPCSLKFEQPVTSHMFTSPDSDDSFVVRTKRKVAFVESPDTRDTAEFTVQKSSKNDNSSEPDNFKTPEKPIEKRRTLKRVRLLSLSDDSPASKVDVPKQKHVSFHINLDSEDDDFVSNDKKTVCSKITETEVFKMKSGLVKRKNPRSCGFIEHEAKLSDDGELVSSDEADHSDLDHYDGSMINDLTQFSQEPADMHAVYLNSLKSPMQKPGRYKLQYDYQHMNVFSQPAQGEDESQYMEDSFCVVDEFEEMLYVSSTEEMEVDFSNPIKKKMKSKRSLIKTGKRKRVCHIQDSSSEDERDSENVLCLDISLVEEKKEFTTHRKKSAIFLSSEEEIGDFQKISKMSNTVNLDGNKMCLQHQKDDNAEMSPANLRAERLRKQREQQEKFRKQFAERLETLVCNSEEMSLSQTTNDSVSASSYSKALDGACAVSDANNINNASIVAASSTHAKFDKDTILVDSREISGAQDLVSSLRFQHNILIITAQLPGCNYIVSNRMAVNRKRWSDFSNGSNRNKIIEQIQHLQELYDRPCLVIEKDRAKPGEGKGGQHIHWTKYVERTMVLLAKTNVKILFTESQVETADMLVELCNLEKRKQAGIAVPVELTWDKTQQLGFYLSIPKVSYIHALNLCHNFKTLSEFLHSLAPTIKRKGQMGETRAREVYDYVRRRLDPQMLPTGIG